MSLFRIYFSIAGGHVHCRVFAISGPNHALCGTLVVHRGAEFESLVRSWQQCDFVGDSETDGIAAASDSGPPR
jgi:hypothetical protein